MDEPKKEMTVNQAIALCDRHIAETTRMVRSGQGGMNAVKVLGFARKKKEQLLILKKQLEVFEKKHGFVPGPIEPVKVSNEGVRDGLGDFGDVPSANDSKSVPVLAVVRADGDRSTDTVVGGGE